MHSWSTNLLERLVLLSSDISLLVYEASQIMKTKTKPFKLMGPSQVLHIPAGALIFEIRKAKPDQGLKEWMVGGSVERIRDIKLTDMKNSRNFWVNMQV